MTEHWLLLDIGNTHTVAGVFRSDGARIAEMRFRTDPHCTADEYRVQLRQLFADQLGQSVWSLVERVVLSTVVPALERIVAQASGTLPWISVNSRLQRDFALDLPHPEQLGADRLCNVAGAMQLAPAPLLIVDAGTATTFCLVHPERGYIGGAIVPGLETSWRALQGRAAKLFAVELIRPGNAVGNTTETQIQSGVLQGYEALIEGMADRLLADARLADATLIATGGCVRLIRLSERFRQEPDLTLLGLLRYGQLNG